MLTRDEFSACVADAYAHLYDLVGLRSHALTDQLVPDVSLDRKEKAWRVHHLLLHAIEELNPGSGAPTFSREWRRHRLMMLHYVDGLHPEAVADRLGISRRQYYREHDAAIEAIAAVLWDRYLNRSTPTAEPASLGAKDQRPTDKLELLRLEVARITRTHRDARLIEVLSSLLSLLHEKLQQHQLELDVVVPDSLPTIPLDRNLLRQLLLGVVGYLAERTDQATIRIEAATLPMAIEVLLHVNPPAAFHPTSATELQDRIATWSDLASVSGATTNVIVVGQTIVGVRIHLPTERQRPVLVVDDNQDMLELLQRYLTLHSFPVITAQTAAEALALAREGQPYAITLDLMMPGEDGWDVLQTLLNQPDTRHIPIIVCSVLREKELALSLGAAAFLEKPVTEQALVGVLRNLDAT